MSFAVSDRTQKLLNLAYDLRKQGLTFKEIGWRLGVNRQWARQLYLIAERGANAEPQWDDGMSVRLANCLSNAGINSREEALAAYQSGKLHPGYYPRNYGWKTHWELAAWLGLPKPQKPFVPQLCPHCGRRLTKGVTNE